MSTETVDSVVPLGLDEPNTVWSPRTRVTFPPGHPNYPGPLRRACYCLTEVEAQRLQDFWRETIPSRLLIIKGPPEPKMYEEVRAWTEKNNRVLMIVDGEGREVCR